MKHQKAPKRVRQCVDLVKLIKNRPRNLPYYYPRYSNAGRGYKNENNCFLYNASGNYHQSCIFHSLNGPTHALDSESTHSLFHMTNCCAQIHSDCSSSVAEELNRKSSKHELFKAESQSTVLSYGSLIELNKVSNTTLNTNKLQQEEHDNSEPCCSNKSKSEIENNTNDATPIDEVSLSASAVISSETITPEEETNNEGSALNVSQSTLQQEATTTVAEHTVSRQMLADEEAGGDGHHNNSIIEIEITLLSGNDTNSEEEDEGDDETPMQQESGE